MKNRALYIPLITSIVSAFALVILASPKTGIETKLKEGAIRVLFLGHDSEHHNSNKYYPMLAKGLGRDAIYSIMSPALRRLLVTPHFWESLMHFTLCESWNNHSQSVEEPKGLRRGWWRFRSGPLRELVFRQRTSFRPVGGRSI